MCMYNIYICTHRLTYFFFSYTHTHTQKKKRTYDVMCVYTSIYLYIYRCIDRCPKFGKLKFETVRVKQRCVDRSIDRISFMMMSDTKRRRRLSNEEKVGGWCRFYFNVVNDDMIYMYEFYILRFEEYEKMKKK